MLVRPLYGDVAPNRFRTTQKKIPQEMTILRVPPDHGRTQSCRLVRLQERPLTPASASTGRNVLYLVVLLRPYILVAPKV